MAETSSHPSDLLRSRAYIGSSLSLPVLHHPIHIVNPQALSVGAQMIVTYPQKETVCLDRLQMLMVIVILPPPIISVNTTRMESFERE